MANAIVGTLILTGARLADGDPDRDSERHLHVRVRRQPLRVHRPLRRRHAERRAVDRDRRVRLRRRRAAVQAVQRPCRRPGARHHDDPDHRADDRGAAAAGARTRCGKGRWRSAPRARGRSSPWCCRPPLPGIVTGVVLALARIAGETAPLLFTSFNNRFFTTNLSAADLVADGAGVHLRDLTLRGLAPAGLGRRARARDHRARLLAARALRHPAPRGDARPLALLCQIGSGKWGRISALARTSSASRLAGVGVFARTARRAPAELAGQRHGPLAERNRRSDRVVLAARGASPARHRGRWLSRPVPQSALRGSVRSDPRRRGIMAQTFR